MIRRITTRRGEDGAVAVIVAICALTLFVIAALVVDLGLARDTRRESQNAADAAALAAVNVLYPTSGKCSDGTATPATGCKADAAFAAKQYAEANFNLSASDWTNCATPPAGFFKVTTYPQCISIDAPGQHVWVVMPDREIKFGFGAAADESSVDVGSAARAVVGQSSASSCGICVLGSGVTNAAGTGDAYVRGGASLSANGAVTTQQNNGHASAIGGGFVYSGDTAHSSGQITPSPIKALTTPLVDPLKDLTLPTKANNYLNLLPSTAVKPAANFCKTVAQGGGPGVYKSPSTSSPCNLAAGLYVIIGTLDANITTANNVTLLFTCANGNNTASVDCAANGQAGGKLAFGGNRKISSLKAPTSGLLKGFAIIYDRSNTSDMAYQGGGSANSITGTIYAPSSKLTCGGNGGQTSDNLIIIKQFAFNGNNCGIDTTYTAGNNVSLPPTPSALDK